MERATPHTVGSVLLTDSRRHPDHMTRVDHVTPYNDFSYHPYHNPSFGFNSAKPRNTTGFWGEGWNDNQDYVMLRNHVTSHRDHVTPQRDHATTGGYSLTTFEQKPLEGGLKRRGKPVDYDLVLASRAAAAAKETTNYCEIGTGSEVDRESLVPDEEGMSGVEVESCSEFMQSITASFIRFIFESDSPPFRRILWFLFWVMCCGYALSNIKAAFTQYFSYETASQLSFIQSLGEELTMPAITICNMNKYRKSWLNLPENDVVFKYEMEKFWGQDVLAENNRSVTKEDDEKAKKLLVIELEKSGKHGITDMFHEVLFDEEDLLGEVGEGGDEEKENILKKHFTEINTELGICYTFNADGKKRVKRTGNDFGATFTININQSEYAETQESAGIKVMLHHFKEPPLIKEYGLAIPPGSEAYISTRTLQLNNLREPYFNCTDRKLRTTDYYSVVACTLECHAKILDEECQCKQSHMPLENITICSLYTHRMCTENAIKKIHNGSYADRISDCWCIDACKDTYYEYSLSRAQYASINAAKKILEVNRNVSEYSTISDLRENFIRLHVYFETLAIENVEKVPAYTTMNLLGDVGGNLGLFIGANVATLAELIDYLARRVHGWVRR